MSQKHICVCVFVFKFLCVWKCRKKHQKSQERKSLKNQKQKPKKSNISKMEIIIDPKHSKTQLSAKIARNPFHLAVSKSQIAEYNVECDVFFFHFWVFQKSNIF